MERVKLLFILQQYEVSTILKVPTNKLPRRYDFMSDSLSKHYYSLCIHNNRWIFFVIGSRRLVRTLLTLGANPNAQDNAEWSPLHEACNRGNLGVVRLLHKHGADINLKGFGRDTPLHDAARNGQLKVTNYFILIISFFTNKASNYVCWIVNIVEYVDHTW